ncbi:glycosyltransferase family 39 protein [Flavobacterium sp.]|uniref:glycosyltransferase family 39 protein n=1 Tax=Flavobacterium sp. TaxID=239 RepID=UPI00248A8236|nr:glycosyltransferase family 39 protein [Flavobacterium sp.]MDI1317575.1 glycosyltransferase family 39 protein [Flavobacterium sp.]
MKIINWLKNNKLLLAIVAFGAVLRFYKLDNQSLWIDELFSMNVANPKNDFRFIYTFLRDHDPHPPLYYFLIHLFFLLFGYTTLVLKLFSTLVGVLGIFSIYYLGKKMVNKQVGYIGAILVSVNYFHIYYSQEGRMYTLLFLTTCIAIYSFFVFIKKSTYQTMILFIIGSSLMIYSQFFGVFVLFSMYIILLYTIIKSDLKERGTRLRMTIIAGIVTVVLYIPSIIIILFNPKRESIWIQPPTWSTFESIFKEFFGFSQILNFIIIALFIIGLILYFIKHKKQQVKNGISPLISPEGILITILLITVILPVVYSKLLLPIVVSRYYICILPAVLILLAIAINNFKNNNVKILILIIFCFFSIKNLIIDKAFYTSFYKTQFKQAVNYMVQETPNDIIVSKLGDFYLRFYLDENNYNKPVIENDINNYVSSIKNDTLNLKNFWYCDGHLPSYMPTNQTQKFIDSYYYIDENVDFFDALIKHYSLKKNYKETLDISMFLPLAERNGNEINFYIEKFEAINNKINFSGWAYLSDQGTESSKTELVVIKENTCRVIFGNKIRREDVTTYFKSQYDLSNSGFSSSFDKNDLEKGNYKIGIYIIDKKNNKKGLVVSDKIFTVN